MTRALIFILCLSILSCTEKNTRSESVAPEPAPSVVEGTPAAPPSDSTPDAPPRAAAPHLTAPPVKGPKLLPVDEGSKDASFVAFRQELLTAVRSRDGEAVLKIADPKIRTSFGNGGGIAEFEKKWKTEDAASPLWAELEHILTHGGSFQKTGGDRRFWAPYVYSDWPENIDPFEHLAVVAKDVALHESANDTSPVLAALSHDIVSRAEPGGPDPKPWQKIKTADGRTGFVDSKLVRSPVGYRAGFAKKNGQWWMEALVAGD